MKKLLFSIALAAFAITAVNAQTQTTTTVKDEKTTKKTSSVPEKVHNTFSKKKHYNGKKMKHTTVVEQNGKKEKHTTVVEEKK